MAYIGATLLLFALAADAQDSQDGPAAVTAAGSELRQWTRDLASGEFRVRQRASHSLQRAGIRSLPYLLEAITSRDAEVSQRAIDIVRDLCSSDDSEIAWAAQEGLSRIARTNWQPASRRVALALAELRQDLEQRAVGELQRMGATVYRAETGYRVSLKRNFHGGKQGVALLEHLPKVVSVSIQYTNLDEAALRPLRGHRELTSLTLSGSNLGDVALEHAAGLVQLNSLYLTSTGVTSAGLAHVRDLKALRGLSLQNSRRITDGGMAHLAGLSGLRALNLSGTRISDTGLAHLAPLPAIENLNLNWTDVSSAGLRHLKLGSLTQLEMQGAAIDDEGLRILGKVSPGFSHLDLESTRVTDAGLEPLRRLTKLTYLNLSRTDVSDTGLSHLAQMRQLNILRLSYSQVTGKGLADFQRRELSELRLDNTPLDDDGLAHLAKFRIRTLNLKSTQITDKGLKELQDLEQVDWLHLEGNEITDAGLTHLASLQNLRGLYLKDTEVTEDGVKQLTKALFRCRIDY